MHFQDVYMDSQLTFVKDRDPEIQGFLDRCRDQNFIGKKDFETS
jgi:hypothetical protein